MAGRQFNIRLDPDLAEALETKARDNFTTGSEVVRKLIREYVSAASGATSVVQETLDQEEAERLAEAYEARISRRTRQLQAKGLTSTVAERQAREEAKAGV